MNEERMLKYQTFMHENVSSITKLHVAMEAIGIIFISQVNYVKHSTHICSVHMTNFLLRDVQKWLCVSKWNEYE